MKNISIGRPRMVFVYRGTCIFFQYWKEASVLHQHRNHNNWTCLVCTHLIMVLICRPAGCSLGKLEHHSYFPMPFGHLYGNITWVRDKNIEIHADIIKLFFAPVLSACNAFST